MTDEELIARLRSNIFGTGTTMLAADRIEALVKERDEAIRAERQTYRDAVEVSARAERLEAAMRKAILLAEQPHYEDRGDALDHCFDAIDVLRAELKGADQ